MNRSFKILDFCIEECDRISKYYHETDGTSVRFFCLSMIDRLNFSAFGVKTLLVESLSNSKAEFSCGLTLRAFLLDYMILLNGIKTMLDAEDESLQNEMETFCCVWLADSIRHMIENISVLYADKPAALKRMYSNIVESNREFFIDYNNDGSKPKFKYSKPNPAKEIFKTIKNTLLSNDQGVYEAYLYFSKYDHFGRMSYVLSREKFVDRIDRLNKSILFMPRMINYILLILVAMNPNDKFILDMKEKTVQFISSSQKIDE